LGNTLTAQRYTSTIQRISSTVRAPYLMQSAIGFERQMPLSTTVAITYANSHGLHQMRSRDINAPLPGTNARGTPASGVFPLERPGQVFLMESDMRHRVSFGGTIVPKWDIRSTQCSRRTSGRPSTLPPDKTFSTLAYLMPGPESRPIRTHRAS
jgi:hypothetical protein